MSRRALASIAITLSALAGGGGVVASANPETAGGGISDTPIAPSPLYQANGVTVTEHIGATVPLDARFQTSDGKPTTLGEVLASSDLPVILTFNYTDCPMLCSLQLNALTAAIPGLATPAPVKGATGADAKSDAVFKVGSQFRIITIDLEPNDTLVKLTKMRDRYLERFPEDQRAAAKNGGWTFLLAADRAAATAGAAPTRNGDEIKRVADAVGFSYTYIPDRAEWAHPAAIMALAPSGKVERYVYGIEYPADVMRETLYAAGIAEPRASSGFLLRCYHFDPGAKDHSRTGMLVLRVGAAGIIVLLLTGIGVYHFARRQPRRSRRPEVS